MAKYIYVSENMCIVNIVGVQLCTDGFKKLFEGFYNFAKNQIGQ